LGSGLIAQSERTVQVQIGGGQSADDPFVQGISDAFALLEKDLRNFFVARGLDGCVGPGRGGLSDAVVLAGSGGRRRCEPMGRRSVRCEHVGLLRQGEGNRFGVPAQAPDTPRGAWLSRALILKQVRRVPGAKPRLLGCGETCPIFPGKRYEDWAVDDPAGQDLETVRRIVDDVDDRVRKLLGELGVTG
jgi:hypothetical protein